MNKDKKFSKLEAQKISQKVFFQLKEYNINKIKVDHYEFIKEN